MKRTFTAILTAVFLIAFVSQVYAETTPQSIIGQQLGVSPDQLNSIPQTPAEAQDLLLKQAWSDIISKNTYLGPVHRFFISISPVFLFLFGESYSLSPTLLGVIILWFYVSMELSIIFNSLEILNAWANRGLAVACSIILAQIGVFRAIFALLSNIIYSSDSWPVRLAIGIGIVVGLFILHYIINLGERQLKKAKKDARENRIENEVKKEREFIRGLKEGSNTYK